MAELVTTIGQVFGKDHLFLGEIHITQKGPYVIGTLYSPYRGYIEEVKEQTGTVFGVVRTTDRDAYVLSLPKKALEVFLAAHDLIES